MSELPRANHLSKATHNSVVWTPEEANPLCSSVMQSYAGSPAMFSQARLTGMPNEVVRMRLTIASAMVSSPSVARRSMVYGGCGVHRSHVPIQAHVRKKECVP